MTATTRRTTLNALPDVLPIFPLEGALLLPRARLPLNIFEPRYLAMVDDALRSEQRLIGMVQPRRAKEAGEAAPPIYDVGCVGRLTSFSETDDGRYLIALSGVIRFEVVEEVDGFTPFRRVTPSWERFAHDLEADESELMPAPARSEFLSLLKRYFEATDLSADWEALSNADYETLVNAIAMLCPFSPQEKQALLEAKTLSDRESDLQALMRFVVAAPGGQGDLQ